MIEFVEYSYDFLDLSWKWLNDEEIKKMTMTPSFSKNQQIEWFLGLKNKKNYYIKGILYNKNPIGVVGLKNITKTRAEYWGYIGEKHYWGIGIGKKMVKYIEQYSKKNNIDTIYLRVDSQNLRAIKLYEKQKFVLTQKIDDILIFEKVIKKTER